MWWEWLSSRTLLVTRKKTSIVAALKKPETKEDLRRVDAKTIVLFQTISLSDFVTRRSLNLFHLMMLTTGFLDSNPTLWVDLEEFVGAKEKIKAIRVVNDCADRAVKLVTDYNMVMTKDEEQHQLIFQIIEHHREMMNLPLKGNFTNKLSTQLTIQKIDTNYTLQQTNTCWALN